MYDKGTLSVVLASGRQIDLQPCPAPARLAGRGTCYRMDEPEGRVVVAVDPNSHKLVGVCVESARQLSVLTELFRQVAAQGFGAGAARASGVMRAFKTDEEAPWTPRVPDSRRRT